MKADVSSGCVSARSADVKEWIHICNSCWFGLPTPGWSATLPLSDSGRVARQSNQMVNSVQRLQEMKAFVRMSSGLDLKKYGWYGDGTGTNGNVAAMVAHTPGIVQDEDGELHFTD